MTDGYQNRAHLSDGDLVRMLDGELSDIEQRRAQRHLEFCAPCGRRVAELRARSRGASEYLAALGDGLPDAAARRRALTAARRAQARRGSRAPLTGRAVAAAIALVVALSTLEATVLDGWLSGHRSTPAPAAPVELAPQVVASVAAPRRGSTISFTPAGPEFRIEIDRHQSAGSLILRLRNVPRATAEVLDSGDESVLVLPSGIRVQNDPATAASYRVVVPSSVRSIRVSVAGRRVRTIEVAGGQAAADQEIPLGAPRGR